MEFDFIASRDIELLYNVSINELQVRRIVQGMKRFSGFSVAIPQPKLVNNIL